MEGISTREAADICGLKVNTFRTAMRRLREGGRDFRLDGPDERTPLWDEAKLAAWLASNGGRR